VNRATRQELERLLDEPPVEPPPVDLAQRIKAEIPRPFSVGRGLEAALGRSKLRRFAIPLSGFVTLGAFMVVVVCLALLAHLHGGAERRGASGPPAETGAEGTVALRAGVDVPRPGLVSRGATFWPEAGGDRPVTVVLELTLDRAGRVRAVRVASGPDDRLTAGLVNAVRTWRYQPTLVAGQPVEVLLTETFRF
jgi:TonB family protein